MSNSRFRDILKAWTDDAEQREAMASFELTLRQSDLHRLQAFAELYGQSLPSITAELLHSAIREVEEAMPYVAGDKVIRVEDGMDIFEDVGPTPKYLQILETKQQV